MTNQLKESNVVLSLRAIWSTLVGVKNTRYYYFYSARKAYVVDGYKGIINSVTLSGGCLVSDETCIYYVNKHGLKVKLIDSVTKYRNEANLESCESLRGKKNPYHYITIGIIGGNSKIYSKYILGLCKYGLDVMKTTSSNKTTIVVVNIDKEKTEGINSFDNITLGNSKNRKYIEVTKNTVLVV